MLVLLGATSLAAVSIAAAVGGTQATSVKLEWPTAAAPIPASQGGGFYIADMKANLVLKVDAGGNVTTVAGTGTAGKGGDGGLATKAELSSPSDAVPTPDGGILIADSSILSSEIPPQVRKVSPSGIITTVAGGLTQVETEAETCAGHTDKFGNGCQATQASLANPTSAVPLAGGGFLIAEYGGNDVRKVNAAGVITLVAGGNVGNPTLCPTHTDEIDDGCPAVGANKYENYMVAPTAAIPFGIEGAAVSTPGTGFLITENQGCRVRYVNAEGIISTVAGSTSLKKPCLENGEAEPPETGTATALKLSLPYDARPTAEAGVFLIADGYACTIYKVNMTTNKYTTFGRDQICNEHKGEAIGATAAIPDTSGGAAVANTNAAVVQSLSSLGTFSVIAGGGTGGRPPEGLPGGTPTPTPTPLPSPAPTPPPSCRFTAHSGVIPLTTHKRKKGSKVAPQPKNTLAVSFVCNQPASVKLGGSITELVKQGGKTKKKLITLSPRSLSAGANATISTTLTVPASALKALKRRVSESATLKLTVANAHGKSSAAVKLGRLSTKK